MPARSNVENLTWAASPPGQLPHSSDSMMGSVVLKSDTAPSIMASLRTAVRLTSARLMVPSLRISTCAVFTRLPKLKQVGRPGTAMVVMCSRAGGSGASRSAPLVVVKEKSCPSMTTSTVLFGASSREGVQTLTLPAGKVSAVRDAGTTPSRSMIETVAESKLVQRRVFVGAAEPANGRKGTPASAHSQALTSLLAASNATAVSARMDGRTNGLQSAWAVVECEPGGRRTASAREC